MSGLLVPGHIARERKRVPSVDTTIGGVGAPDALSASNVMTDEQIALAMKRWDVDPIGQRIFVAPISREKSSGGIFMIQTTADLSWDGVVIAAGPLAFVHRNPPEGKDIHDFATYDEVEKESSYRLRPGDRVTFARWSGEEMRRWWLDAPSLKVMNADDVIGMTKEMK